MTGTSLDGIDLSLCFTDGKTRLKNIKSSYVAYKTVLRKEIKDCIIRFDNYQYTPPVVEGGLLYSGSEFYLGLE